MEFDGDVMSYWAHLFCFNERHSVAYADLKNKFFVIEFDGDAVMEFDGDVTSLCIL
jgi:hypothetical protein